MTDFAREITDAEFDDVVINGSHSQLVVVDFWAPWCGPCRVLKPVLESLAAEFVGRFLLAMVNADENAGACRAHSVRGIPTVKAFLKGVVVDEFTGALSETYVRDFISRNIPSPVADLVRDAQDLRRQGMMGAALERIDEAIATDPEFDAAKVEKAEILLAQGAIDLACGIVDGLRGDVLDYEHTHQLIARVGIARQVLLLASREELEQQVQHDNNNHLARLGLALHDAVAGKYERALEQLLSVVRSQPNLENGAARKAMLAIFEILGHGDPLVAQFRRGLASVLH